MEITINLPWPDAALSPNRKSGRSWQVTHRIKTESKASAYFTAMALPLAERCMLAQMDFIPLALDFHPPDKRRRDLDNAFSALKPQLDSIAEAIGVDDSRFHPIVLDWGEVVPDGLVTVSFGITEDFAKTARCEGWV